MKKLIVLAFVLMILAGCSSQKTLTTAQSEKIQALKDEIAELKLVLADQEVELLKLNSELNLYNIKNHAPDISEFNELYQTYLRWNPITPSEVIYDTQTNQSTVLFSKMNASLSFSGKLPEQVIVYDTAIGVWFYWVTETNVVQLLSYERFSTAVLSSAEMTGSLSMNDGTVLVKFKPANGLTGSDQTIAKEFLSRQFVLTLGN